MSPVARSIAASRAIWMLLLFVLAASKGLALERFQRKLDFERGLPFSEVNSIAQDTHGFIWITAGGALFRYDGVNLKPWAREPLRRYIKLVVTGPAGEVLVREGTSDTGRVYEVVGQELRSVSGRDNAPLSIRGPPVWDASANLWVITADGKVCFRLPGGAWSELLPARFNAETPSFLQTSADGAAILVTISALWRINQPTAATRLAPISGVQRVLAPADGSLVVLFIDPRGGGTVVELNRGITRELFHLAARPIDMVRHGHTLWVAYDTLVAVLRPDEPPELLGPQQQVPSGGPMLVDQEGSLWLASFRGLLQYPAPDTGAWGVADGMTSSSTRRLALSRDGLWVDSWTGLTLLRHHESRWRPERVSNTKTSPVCVGTDGAVWTAAQDRLLEFRSGKSIERRAAGLLAADSCASGAQGRVWFATNLGLMLARGGPSGSTPTLFRGPPHATNSGADVSILEDSRAQLWVTSHELACHADAGEMSFGRPAPWACSRVEGVGRFTSLVEVSPGVAWASTLQAGVYRQRPDNRWEPIHASRSLPTLCVRRLRPSPSGGIWIVSYGTILRVVERPDTSDGWEIAERPSQWHGLMISDAEDILEEPNGDLWITTLAGLVHIPADVRRSVPPVPRVELVEVLADGKALAWDHDVRLPFHRNRIELRFAALSFRDPALLRYQVRLRPDAPWLDSGQPSFQFVDLPPGRYHAAVRASLDGREWSYQPAAFSFTVEPPFWRTWWFALSMALLTAGGGVAIYRARIRQVIEVERMRTRIAMDLHDDVGSSLSQIALRSELALSRLDRGEGDAAAALDQISNSARSVVDAMSDVVWSVDPRHDVLSDLVRRIRAFALEAEGSSEIEVRLELPDPEHDLRLSALVRRQVYLVFKEALNNALRHAGATRVDIALELRGSELELSVADDGVGFESDAMAGANEPPIARGGHGLASMRQRALECGGRLAVERPSAGGTVVRLVVPLS